MVVHPCPSGDVCIFDNAVKYQGTLDEAQDRYMRGAKESGESTSLIALPSSLLLHTNTSEPSITMHGCKEILGPSEIAKIEAAAARKREEIAERRRSGERVASASRSDSTDASTSPRTIELNTDDVTPAAKASFDLWRRRRQRQAARARIAFRK